MIILYVVTDQGSSRSQCFDSKSVKGLSLMFIRGVARIFQRGGHRGYSPDHHPGIADYKSS